MTDVSISGGKITLNNQAYIEMYDTNTGSVNLSGGELNINDNSGILLDGANDFTMTGGFLTATSNGNSADTGVFVKGNGADVNIQGGDINLTDSRIYKGNDTATTGDINISGGNITLNKNAYIEMRNRLRYASQRLWFNTGSRFALCSHQTRRLQRFC